MQIHARLASKSRKRRSCCVLHCSAFTPCLPYGRLLSFASLGLGGRRDNLFLATPTKEMLAKEELHILSLSLPPPRGNNAIQLVIIQKQSLEQGLSESIWPHFQERKVRKAKPLLGFLLLCCLFQNISIVREQTLCMRTRGGSISLKRWLNLAQIP